VDFDMYHLQHSEGNLTLNLQEGLKQGYIRFVEVGDVPGRLEPGTGETNYAHMFRVLREAGYEGYVGMEHRASTNFADALARVRRLAGMSV
jgi:hydroxypyruvate isomerase